jgi:hypothetical protein
MLVRIGERNTLGGGLDSGNDRNGKRQYSDHVGATHTEQQENPSRCSPL